MIGDDKKQKLTVQQLGQMIRQKYPTYQNIEDSILIPSILKKYPQYNEILVDGAIDELTKPKFKYDFDGKIGEIDSQITDIDSRRDSLLQVAGEEYRRPGDDPETLVLPPPSLVSGHRNVTAQQDRPPVPEAIGQIWDDDKKKAYLSQAQELLKKAKDYNKNATDGNSVKAFAQGLTSSLAKDFLTLGINELGRTYNVAGVAKKANEGSELSDEERALLSAYGVLQQARQDDGSVSYLVGQGLADMVPYMAQFAITGGVGTGIKGGVKKLLKTQLQKEITKQTGKRISGAGLKNLAKRGAAYTAGAAAQTPVMPLSHTKIQQRQIGYVSEEGEILEPGEDKLTATWKGMGEGFAEVFAERGGQYIVSPWKLLPGMAREASEKAVKKGFFSGLVRGFRKKAAFDQPLEEYAEELLTSYMTPAITGDKPLSEVWDSKEQLVTALTVVGMGGAFNSANMVERGVSDTYIRERYLGGLDKELRGEVIKTVRESKNPSELGDNLHNILTGTELNRDQKKRVLTYAMAQVSKNSSDEFRKQASKEVARQQVYQDAHEQFNPLRFQDTDDIYQMVDGEGVTHFIKDGTVEVNKESGEWKVGEDPLVTMSINPETGELLDPVMTDPKTVRDMQVFSFSQMVDANVMAFDQQFDEEETLRQVVEDIKTEAQGQQTQQQPPADMPKFEAGQPIMYNGEKGEVVEAFSPEEGIVIRFDDKDGDRTVYVRPDEYDKIEGISEGISEGITGEATGEVTTPSEVELKVGSGKKADVVSFALDKDDTYISKTLFEDGTTAKTLSTKLNKRYPNLDFEVEDLTDAKDPFAESQFSIRATLKPPKTDGRSINIPETQDKEGAIPDDGDGTKGAGQRGGLPGDQRSGVTRRKDKPDDVPELDFTTKPKQDEKEEKTATEVKAKPKPDKVQTTQQRRKPKPDTDVPAPERKELESAVTAINTLGPSLSDATDGQRKIYYDARDKIDEAGYRMVGGVLIKKEPKAKEPWQMTQGEWGGEVWEGLSDAEREEWGNAEPEEKAKKKNDIVIEPHIALIKQAFSEGKPVPDEVLKDYPELAHVESEQEAMKRVNPSLYKLAQKASTPDEFVELVAKSANKSVKDIETRHLLEFYERVEKQPPIPTPKKDAKLPDDTAAKDVDTDVQRPETAKEPTPTTPAEDRSGKPGAENRVFTEDAKNAALERLRKKRGEIKTGIDPQEMMDAVTVAGYHIENGARKFSDFTKRMVNDVGDWIKPYLKGLYENIRRYPGMEAMAKEMDSTEIVDNYSFEEEPTEKKIYSFTTDIEKTQHTKTHEDLYTTKLMNREEKDTFNEIRRIAKTREGGAWSNYLKAFIFRTEQDAISFRDEVEEKYGDVKPEEPPQHAGDILVVKPSHGAADPLTWAKENRDALIDKYITDNNRHVDPDKVRELFTPIGYKMTNVEEYRPGERYLVSEIYTEILKRNPDEKVIIVMGIPGAGKSAFVRDELQNGFIVFDAVMSGEAKPYNYIDEAGKGEVERQVQIIIVNTAPSEAFTGTINRGFKTGRFVPIYYMLNAVRAYENNYKKLVEKFGNSINIVNFVRKGDNISKEGKIPTEIDYNVSYEQLYETYINHPQYKELSDEQKQRIEGKAAGQVQTVDAGGRKGETGAVGRGSEEGIGETGSRRLPGITKDIPHGTQDNRQPISGEQATVDEGQQPTSDVTTLQGGQAETARRGESTTGVSDTGPDDETGAFDGRSPGVRDEPRSPGREFAGGQFSDQSEDVRPDRGGDQELTPESNHIINPGDVIVPRGEVSKIRSNIAAIKLAKRLEKSGDNATPNQKDVLARYTGWGGLSAVFKNEYWNENWSKKYKQFYDQLNELLTREEIQAAKESTINAHYTDRRIIQSMWAMASRLGFKGGKVLEPGSGVGHFFGLMPKDLHGATQLRGIEIDKISGLILSKLYPKANIGVHGFETMNDANNQYDLAIGNVPFADVRVYDSKNKDISKDFNLHNYFIAKSIRKLKPGSVGIFITTNSTLDNEGQGLSFRKWVTSPEGGNADFIDAVRLPNNTFKENAGTEVTTDIIIIRKRDGAGQLHADAKKMLTNESIAETKTKEGEKVFIRVNEYYAKNPDKMLGVMKLAYQAGGGGLYTPDKQTLHAPNTINVADRLNEFVESLPENIFVKGEQQEPIEVLESAEEGQREGEVVVKDGKVYQVRFGKLQAPDWNTNKVGGLNNKKYTKAQVVTEYVKVKKAIRELLAAEVNPEMEETQVDELRKQLNTHYDGFVKKFGTLNDNMRIRFLQDDVESTLTFSIENIKQVEDKSSGKIGYRNEISKSDIFSKRVNRHREEPKKANNINDAFDISIAYRNKLDLPYMAELLSKTQDEVQNDLLEKELAYINPENGLVEQKDEYLSGWVRKKLDIAKKEAEDNPQYKVNTEALEKVIPKDIPLINIDAQLGASWIPGKIVARWMEDLLDIRNVRVAYNSTLDKWGISARPGYNNAKVNNEFGVEGMDAIALIKSALNQQQPVIYDTYYEAGQRKQTKNQEKTVAAQNKINELKSLFKNRIFDLSQQEKDELERLYNDKYNGYVNQQHSIPDIKYFPGASQYRVLRDHQKTGVKRGLLEPTLLAHQVGTGKTYTLITIAQEMRRLGIAKKPMIVVQRATLSQFTTTYKKLYPNARLLVPSKKDLERKNRQRLFAQIAMNDWDAVIIDHNFLNRIPDSPDRQIAYIMQRIEELRDVRDFHEGDESVRYIEHRINSDIEKLQDQIDRLGRQDETIRKEAKASVKDEAKTAVRTRTKLQRQLDRDTDMVLYFEDMGVDALLIDEAHTYKRLGFTTKGQQVKGIDVSGSKKAMSTKFKLQYILENNNGKNVVFSTGTPISNTMAEAWTMMNYLIPDRIREYGISHFDEFRTVFGSVEPSIEFTAAGNFKVVDRFSKYVNLPELKTLWQSVADVVLTEEIDQLKAGVGTPHLKNGKETIIELPMTDALQHKMDEFKQTLRRWEQLSGKEKKEQSHIPLVVFGLAKRAAIDVRLVDSSAEDDPKSKLNRAVTQIMEVYKKTSDYKGTQLVFSDMIQNADGNFNLYEDIREKLVNGGIPKDEIAIIGEHKTDDKKEKLFDKVNSGEVRVVLGSTDKLGIGVNVQERLAAVHHIDAPARPMDFEQRNGRILRQGNLHLEMDIPVEVFLYGVEKTLDATAYQRLAIKGRFIKQMMTKDITGDRSIEDETDDTSNMTFDQMMANLSGSKYAIIHVKKASDLRNMELAKRAYESQQLGMNDKIMWNRRFIEGAKKDNKFLVKAQELFGKHIPDGEVKSIKINDRDKISDPKKFEQEWQKHLESKKKQIDAGQEVKSIIILNDKVKFIVTSKNESNEVLVKDKEGEPVKDKKGNFKTKYEFVLFSTGRVEIDGEGIGKTGYKNSYKTLKGLLNSASEKIREVPGQVTANVDYIKTREKENVNLLELLNKPYPNTDKLKQLREEVAQLEVKMEEETKDIAIPPETQPISQGDLLPDVLTDTETAAKEVLSISNAPKIDVEDAATFYDEIQNGVEPYQIGQQTIKNIRDKDATEEDVVETLVDRLTEAGLLGDVEVGNDIEIQVTPIGKRLLSLIENRIETRKGVAAGEDLFPEEANIPEVTKQPLSTGRVRFSLSEKTEPFYSNTLRALQGISQPKATPEQWRKMLEKKGAKKAEMGWMGWDEFSSGKKSVTKQEIQNWIAENKVEIEEVVSGDTDNTIIKTNDDGSLYLAYRDTGEPVDDNDFSTDEDLNAYYEFLETTGDRSETKYSQYQTPGGENYKEWLLTMPAELKGQFPITFEEWEKKEKEVGRSGSFTAWKQAKGRYFAQDKREKIFEGSHFDEPNVVVHIRTNERTDAGGNKVLFIEEVQSDWAQKGKKEGFESETDKQKVVYNFAKSIYFTKRQLSDGSISEEEYKKKMDSDKVLSQSQGITENDLQKAMEKYGDFTSPLQKGIPDMPFKQTPQWTGLAIKRMVQYAAENGFDRVAWTTGEMQAERYDLRKQVDAIHYVKEADGSYSFNAEKDGNEFAIIKNNLTWEELVSQIGKDVAGRMKNNEGIPRKGKDVRKGAKTLKEDDLIIGGEAMKVFYDKILPSTVNKMFKRYGVRVGESDVNISTSKFKKHYLALDLAKDLRHSGKDVYIENFTGDILSISITDLEQSDKQGIPLFIKAPIDEVKVNSITLTPDLIEAALGGFPMFKVVNNPNYKEYDHAGDLLKNASKRRVEFEHAARARAINLEKEFGVTVRVVAREADLPDSYKPFIREHRGMVKGVFDGKNTVHIILNNIRDTDDLTKTFVHEIVGHKGLQGLLGDKIDAVLFGVWGSMSEGERQTFQARYKTTTNILLMAEEYLAMKAETADKPTFIQKAIAAIRNLLRRMTGLKYTDNDINALLNRSLVNLKKQAKESPVKEKGKSEFIGELFGKAEGKVTDTPDIRFSLEKEKPDASDEFAGSTLKEQYKGLENKWFSNRDWETTKATIEVAKLQREIKEAYKKHKPEGATSWRDVDKAIHVYLDMLADPDAINTYWDKLSSYQKNIIGIAKNLSPQTKGIAMKIREQYDIVGDRALQEGVIRNILDNYVARVWDLKKDQDPTEFWRKFGTTTRHAKKRTFGTIVEGWANGYNLKIEGATNNLGVLKTEIYNVIEHKKFIEEGLDTKDEAGNSLFSYYQLPGYERVKHPNFRHWKRVKSGKKTNPKSKKYLDKNIFIADDGTVYERKNIYAPKKIARKLNNILMPSGLKGVPGIDQITKFNAMTKKTVLSWSFFHHMAFMRSYMLAGAVNSKDWNPVKAYKGGLEAMMHMDPLVELLVRNGLTLGRVQDWDEAAIQEKTRIGRYLDNQKATREVKEKVLNLHNAHVNFLFGQFGAGLKVKAAMLEYRLLLDKHPHLSQDELAAMAARIINADFGGLHLQRMGRNPTIQHIMRLTLLAPDWCTDLKTRAMTKTGWKSYRELSIGDEILAFDPKTKTYKWSRMKDMYVNEHYNGKMVFIKNHNRGIMMTPDHKCYVHNYTTKRDDIVKANELQTNHLIPRCAEFNFSEKETFNDYFIKMVGWLVTDGYIKKSTNKLSDGSYKEYRYGKITQSKPKMVEILMEFGMKHHTEKIKPGGINKDGKRINGKYPKHVFTIPEKEFKKVQEEGLEDGLNWEFLSKLTKRQLQLLYHTMMLGDGTGQNRFCGKEKEVFYMTMIQTMLGLPSTFYQQEENCWRTRHIKSKYIYTWGHHNNTSEVDYQGAIWCPSVDTGFWVAEREGLMFITGNTESNVQTVIKMFSSKTSEERAMYRKFWTRVALRGAMATTFLNLLLALWDDPDDKETYLETVKKRYKEAFEKPGRLRWLAADITPVFRALGGDAESERRYFHLIGHFKDPIKFIVDLPTSFKHKTSIVGKIISDAWGGENWQGRRFTTAAELLGTDDKGVYQTSSGEHIAGDPKGGKHKGQTVKWNFGGNSGPVKYNEMPSYIINQARGLLPIPLQNLLAYSLGEIDYFDAATHGVGFHVSRKRIYGGELEKAYEKYKVIAVPITRRANEFKKQGNIEGYNEIIATKDYTNAIHFRTIDKTVRQYDEFIEAAVDRGDDVMSETLQQKRDILKQQAISLFEPENNETD